MTTWLLITGSRDASPSMLEHAARCVQRAKEHGWGILVGDAPGVDTAVVHACQSLFVPFHCYGITPEPRCGRTPLMSYHSLPTNYLQRDECMVNHADRCHAIWNGYSRGTKYTHDFALQRGLPTTCSIFKVDKF